MPAMSPILGVEHRHALTLLRKSANGLSHALIEARGVPASVLRDLIRAKLVTVEAQRRRGYGRMVVVKRLRITDAGRRALG
jgi:hypothetical protein